MTDVKKNINNNESFLPGIHATAKIFIGWVANIKVIKKDKIALKWYLFKKNNIKRQDIMCNNTFVVCIAYGDELDRKLSIIKERDKIGL